MMIILFSLNWDSLYFPTRNTGTGTLYDPVFCCISVYQMQLFTSGSVIVDQTELSKKEPKLIGCSVRSAAQIRD